MFRFRKSKKVGVPVESVNQDESPLPVDLFSHEMAKTDERKSLDAKSESMVAKELILGRKKILQSDLTISEGVDFAEVNVKSQIGQSVSSFSGDQLKTEVETLLNAAKAKGQETELTLIRGLNEQLNQKVSPHIQEQIGQNPNAREKTPADDAWSLRQSRNKAIIARVLHRARDQIGLHGIHTPSRSDFEKVDFTKILRTQDGDEIAQDLFETRVKRGDIFKKPIFR